jgi:predicted RNA binding protein YcfA (HicA-like mRNA interferase family)
MNRKALLARLVRGEVRNVHFSDFRKLVEGFGFQFARREGSHHIYSHPQVRELVNLQEVGGEAKPYQVRQVLRLVERYNLVMKGPDE